MLFAVGTDVGTNCPVHLSLIPRLCLVTPNSAAFLSRTKRSDIILQYCDLAVITELSYMFENDNAIADTVGYHVINFWLESINL